ncbi:MAG: hypothetical protein ABEJ96_03355 [Thiohalorhabdaceae bacterium]
MEAIIVLILIGISIRFMTYLGSQASHRLLSGERFNADSGRMGIGLGDDHCTNPIYDHLPCNIHHDPFDDGPGGVGNGLDDAIGGTGTGGIGSDPFDD